MRNLFGSLPFVPVSDGEASKAPAQWLVVHGTQQPRGSRLQRPGWLKVLFSSMVEKNDAKEIIPMNDVKSSVVPVWFTFVASKRLKTNQLCRPGSLWYRGLSHFEFEAFATGHFKGLSSSISIGIISKVPQGLDSLGERVWSEFFKNFSYYLIFPLSFRLKSSTSQKRDSSIDNMIFFRYFIHTRQVFSAVYS